MKRIFDISLSILLFLPSAFLVLIAAVFIKLESSGPAIFKQERVGYKQQTFTMFKLRTMHLGTGDQASHETALSSITKVGRILRKLKIDELPQIWSVLVGDMSFVGPRPCLIVQEELIEARRVQEVFSVLPGITGPAQIQNVDMSTPQKLAKIDGLYVQEQSFRRDIYYIIATAFGKGAGDAVK